MSSNDLIQIGVGFLITAIVVTFALLFPVYKVPNPDRIGGSQFVRRPVWDPATVVVGQGYNNVLEHEIDQMPAGPEKEKKLSELKSNPNQITLRPIYFPARGTNDRNMLGAIALYGSMGFIAFVIFKFVNRG